MPQWVLSENIWPPSCHSCSSLKQQQSSQSSRGCQLSLTVFTVFQGVAAESFLDSFKFCHQDLHAFKTWRPSINAVQLGGFAGKRLHSSWSGCGVSAIWTPTMCIPVRQTIVSNDRICGRLECVYNNKQYKKGGEWRLNWHSGLGKITDVNTTLNISGKESRDSRWWERV